MLFADALNFFCDFPEVVARHGGEQMVFDLHVQAPGEPVMERGESNVSCRNDLRRVKVFGRVVYFHGIVVLNENKAQHQPAHDFGKQTEADRRRPCAHSAQS